MQKHKVVTLSFGWRRSCVKNEMSKSGEQGFWMSKAAMYVKLARKPANFANASLRSTESENNLKCSTDNTKLHVMAV